MIHFRVYNSSYLSNFSRNSYAKKKKKNHKNNTKSLKKSKTTQNYFDNCLDAKEEGESNLMCVYDNLDPNCLSQNIIQQNDWESGREISNYWCNICSERNIQNYLKTAVSASWHVLCLSP